MSSNTLIIPPKIFKERTPVHTNTDDKLLTPIIKVVQDFRMPELLGSALLAKIQTDVAAGTTTGNYITFRNDYLIDVMIWLVMAEMPDTLQYQYFNNGVSTIQADKTQIVDRVKVDQLKIKYLSYAEYYIKRAMAYLRQNATAMFPEYLQVIATLDAIAPTNTAYTCPIYLGDESNYPYDNYSTRQREQSKGNNNLNYPIN